jgi:hypothetical protein
MFNATAAQMVRRQSMTKARVHVARLAIRIHAGGRGIIGCRGFAEACCPHKRTSTPAGIAGETYTRVSFFAKLDYEKDVSELTLYQDRAVNTTDRAESCRKGLGC